MGFVGNYICNLASMVIGRELARPLLFSWYVTHRCDLACRYCCDGQGKPFKQDRVPELALPEVRDLLRIVRRAANVLDITGGEPLVRTDLEQIIDHARTLGFQTVLNTKGIGLADRPEIMRLTDVLVLSVDSLDPTRLAQILGRNQSQAAAILESLRYAIQVSHQSETRLVISTVATPDTLDDAGAVLRFAMRERLGFQLSPEIVGTQVHPSLKANQAYQRLVAEVIQYKRDGKGILGIEPYLHGIRDFRRFRCHPLLMPTLRPDGKLYYPCLESGQAEVSVLDAGSYDAALAQARARYGPVPDCGDRCQIFCHMALSMLQRHPICALGELRHLRN